MNIQVICIGDELLSGDTINTNLVAAGECLAANGLAVTREICVQDSRESILDALRAADGADAVILIGGLGPTIDDLTRPTVAEYLGYPLSLNTDVRAHIVDYLGQRSRILSSEALDIQSQVPQKAEILFNETGTAPGLIMHHGSTVWFLLPGPPREFTPMFEKQCLPKILARSKNVFSVLTARICGLPESQVESIARKALADFSPEHFSICIKSDCIMLRVAFSPEHDLRKQVRQVLENAFGYRLLPQDCASAAQYLGQLAVERNLQISTAESCTGGGIAKNLTAVPGSSQWFVGSMVTYANEWKHNCLGVSWDTLNSYGAVSEQTVHEMLSGLEHNWGATAGMAVSGIAGPGGGTPDKPVGTVVIGAFAPGWREVRTFHFSGTRDTVRSKTEATAVNLLICGLLGKQFDF